MVNSLNEIFDEDVEELPEIKTAINFAPAITAKRTKSGIIREVHVKPKALEGIVKHVGTPLYCDQCEIAPGDVVAFELNANMIVNIEGKDYYVIPYRDILAKSTK